MRPEIDVRVDAEGEIAVVLIIARAGAGVIGEVSPAAETCKPCTSEVQSLGAFAGFLNQKLVDWLLAVQCGTADLAS